MGLVSPHRHSDNLVVIQDTYGKLLLSLLFFPTFLRNQTLKNCFALGGIFVNPRLQSKASQEMGPAAVALDDSSLLWLEGWLCFC